MGLGRAPDQSRFMERRVDVGERRGPEVVDVLGELGLEELVAGWGGDAGSEQHAGREPSGRPQQRQRPAALLIDVEFEQRPDLRPDRRGGLGPGESCCLADLLGRAPGELLHMDPFDTALHPGTECRFDRVSERGGVLGESPEVLGRWSCRSILGVGLLHDRNGDPPAPSFAHRTDEQPRNQLMRIRALSVFEHVVYHCWVVDPTDPGRPTLEVEALLRDGDADSGPLLLSIADYITMVGGLDTARPCLDRFRDEGRILDHLGVPHLAFPLWTPVMEE